jgi:parallel beta-helix repeat protein
LELDEIKEKITTILTEKWMTKPEIFDQFPPFKDPKIIRAIIDFLNDQIEEGVIKKKLIDRRINYGIFDEEEEIEFDELNNQGLEAGSSSMETGEKEKDWNDSELRVKIGKTIYTKPTESKKPKTQKKKEDVINGQLVIENIEDLEKIRKKYKITGNGSDKDPYIIKNLNFDGKSNKNGIYIANIQKQKHLIIYDCTIRNCKEFGISLINTQNVKLKNNRIVLNKGSGIILKDTSNIEIIENFILNNVAGIKIVDSKNIKISKSEVNSNKELGVKFESSSENEINDNLCSYNGIGLDLEDCNGNLITKNELKSNKKQGLHAINSHENRILKNIVLNNGSGIELVNSCNNLIELNEARLNNDGISLFNSSDNQIQKNKILKNKTGIYLDRSTRNSLIKNHTESNSEDGLYLFESYENEIN